MLGKIRKKILRHRSPQPVRRRAIDRSESSSDSQGAASAGNYIFRRNRTLTGSLVSTVSSPNEHLADLKSPRVQAHVLRNHKRKIMLGLLATLAAIAALFWLLSQAIVTPKVTLVGADSAEESSRYEQAIQDYLSAHPSERLRATVNTKNLTTYLQQHNYPELQQVESKVSANGFGSATFSIVLRFPVVSWQAGKTLVYVDTNGVAFYHNVYATPEVQVIDQTGVQATTDQVLVSNRFLEFIGKTVGYFAVRGYKVSSIVLPENTTHQLQIRLDGVSYPIKFLIDRPAAGQVEDAVRAIVYLSNSGLKPAYLDVRVSGRAFYK